MKKDSTVNTFQDGLIMDLNPILTPNTALTNCLNGTIVTFNGNENVLQNDMGNGRVETAYLPEGYVPVGTTELGGIIYIVSYNPLKDKCQIGCFPSPERNITSDNLSDLKSVSIKNKDFINNENHEIKTTLVRIKLLDNKKLFPGDKFSLYAPYGDDNHKPISRNKDYISDIYSELESDPKIGNNPKNMTIHVISIGDDEKITYLDDSLKWSNSLPQYYIKEIKDEKDSIKKDVDSNRTATDTGYTVFNSKVAGELALLCELETIDTFYLTWYPSIGQLDKPIGEYDTYATIMFDINWTSSNKNINPKYLVLTQSDPTNIQMKIYQKDKSAIKSVINLDNLQYGDYCKIEPGKDRNNDGSDKSISVIAGDCYYKSIPEDNKELTWKYKVQPAMSFGKIPFLEKYGIINIKDIGSGKIVLSEWKYYIQNNDFYLNWGLQAYPEKGKSIKKTIFTFIPFDKISSDSIIDTNPIGNENYDGCPQYSISDLKSFSGYFQELFKFNGDDKINNGVIKKNLLYLVDICVIYGITENSDSDKYIHNYRWMYTTGQWNDKYTDLTISDFDNLDLSSAFELTPDMLITDNIKEESTDIYPKSLYDIEYPDSRNSTGIKVTNIGFTKSGPNNPASYDDSSYIDIQTEINPSKYRDLFKFVDSDNSVEYEYNMSNKEIELKNYNILQDKESTGGNELVGSIIDVNPEINEKFNEQLYANNTNQILNGILNSPSINSSAWNTYNSDARDTFFTSTRSTGQKSKIIVRGSIFSRINGDFANKKLKFDQRIRPILYNTDDYDKLGFKSEGDYKGLLKYFFTEDHHNEAGTGIQLQFRQYNIEDNSHIINEKNYIFGKDYEDKSSYWNNGITSYDYINEQMIKAGGPFQIMQYNVTSENENDDLNVIYNGIYLDAIHFDNITGEKSTPVGIWAKTNKNHFIPLNAFYTRLYSNLTSNASYKRIIQDIKSILMQIYYIEPNPSETYYKCVLDNINYLSSYTELWKFDINCVCSVDNKSMNDLIQIQVGEEKKTLIELQNIFSENTKVNISNISYNKDFECSGVKSFQHSFDINMNYLYNLYQSQYKIVRNARYDISTKEKPQLGKTLTTSNSLYVYDGEQFIQLSDQTSQYIKIPYYSNGYSAIEEKTFSATPQYNKLLLTLKNPVTNAENLSICNYFIYQNGELLLNEDSILENKCLAKYCDSRCEFKCSSNSKDKFLIGKAVSRPKS